MKEGRKSGRHHLAKVSFHSSDKSSKQVSRSTMDMTTLTAQCESEEKALTTNKIVYVKSRHEVVGQEEDTSDGQSTIATATLIYSSPLVVHHVPYEDQQQQHNSRRGGGSITSGSSSSRRRKRQSLQHLTEGSIRAFMEDYYEDYNNCIDHHSKACWEAFFESRYDAKRYVLIRPSGNPIDAKGFCSMMVKGNLKLLRMTLVCVDEIKIMADGLAAIVVFTADQDFDYKGSLNRDRSTTTAIIEEVHGEPKIIHEHRSTGQPSPTTERWT